MFTEVNGRAVNIQPVFTLDDEYSREISRFVECVTEGKPNPAPGEQGVVLMRIIDALPILYLVGFVVVLGTGARQQRIGDLLANTTVAHR